MREILASAETIFKDENLKAGQEVHITLVPSLDDPGKLEPTRLSVFGDGHEHLVTVARSAGGDFIASATPPAQEIVAARLAS